MPLPKALRAPSQFPGLVVAAGSVREEPASNDKDEGDDRDGNYHSPRPGPAEREPEKNGRPSEQDQRVASAAGSKERETRRHQRDGSDHKHRVGNAGIGHGLSIGARHEKGIAGST